MTTAEQVHQSLLTEWRRAMDLVGPGPLEPHFEDAARAVDGLGATGAWADLGSGAGFPGVALAARHPEAQVVLVESRQKRVAFLRTVLGAAGLDNARVVHGRVEDLSPGFDGVISRAYRPPEAYLDDARRLLVPEGVAVLLLGRAGEVPAGWTVVDDLSYSIGEGQEYRERRRVVVRPS